jgi:predicted DNA-binding protein
MPAPPTDADGKVTLSVRITPDLRRRLKIAAANAGTDIQTFVTEAVEKRIQEQESR